MKIIVHIFLSFQIPSAIANRPGGCGDAGVEKVTGVPLNAAVVFWERVTVVPDIACTVVPGAIPAPATFWPSTMPVPLATVKLVDPLDAVPVVATPIETGLATTEKLC